MLQQKKHQDGKAVDPLPTTNLRRGASLSLSSLDERLFLGLQDDDISSLGDTFRHNEAIIGDAQSSSDDEGSDGQFLQKVADINAQMAAQLVGLARRDSIGLEKPQLSNELKEDGSAGPGAEKSVDKIVKPVKKHSSSISRDSKHQGEAAQTGRRRQTKRRSYRRLTLDLLTSDEETNEFFEERQSPYMEPLTRRNRQVAEPNRRSSFETLYGDEFWASTAMENSDRCSCSCHDSDSVIRLCDQPRQLVEAQKANGPIGCQNLQQESSCNTQLEVKNNLSVQKQNKPVVNGPASEQLEEKSKVVEAKGTAAEKMAGSQAIDHSNATASNGSTSRYRLYPRRAEASAHRDKLQKLPENHTAGVRFSLPESVPVCHPRNPLYQNHSEPVKNDSPPLPAAPPPPPRMHRATVRFRSGSFSQDQRISQQIPQQPEQSSRLEIGVLVRSQPSLSSSKSARGGDLVVTNLRRVDSRDPVSQLEFMCRAMRLDDPDLMEGAARRDRLESTRQLLHEQPAPPRPPRRRWSTNNGQQNQWPQGHRLNRHRDDQARRCFPGVAASSTPQHQQPSLTNFIGRASDGDRARNQDPNGAICCRRINAEFSSQISAIRHYQSTKLILSNLAEKEDQEMDEIEADKTLAAKARFSRQGGSIGNEDIRQCLRTRWRWLPRPSHINAAAATDTRDLDADSATTPEADEDSVTSSAGSSRSSSLTGVAAPYWPSQVHQFINANISNNMAGAVQPSTPSLIRKAVSMNDVGRRSCVGRHSSYLALVLAPAGSRTQSKQQQKQPARFWKTVEVRYGSESELSKLQQSEGSSAAARSPAVPAARCKSSYFVQIKASSSWRSQPTLMEEEAE